MSYVEKPLEVGAIVVRTQSYGRPSKTSPHFRLLEKVREWSNSKDSYWKLLVLDGKYTGRVVYSWHHDLMIAPQNSLPERYEKSLPQI